MPEPDITKEARPFKIVTKGQHKNIIALEIISIVKQALRIARLSINEIDEQ